MTDNPFDFSAEAAATDQELASRLAALQALSPEQVNKLLPDPGDQKQIEALIASVNAATSQNAKVTAMRQSLVSAGGALGKLFGALKV